MLFPFEYLIFRQGLTRALFTALSSDLHTFFPGKILCMSYGWPQTKSLAGTKPVSGALLKWGGKVKGVLFPQFQPAGKLLEYRGGHRKTYPGIRISIRTIHLFQKNGLNQVTANKRICFLPNPGPAKDGSCA
jgi:hypothetical protein